MRINNFTGGLSTRLAAHLIDSKYARVFTNVNYKSGELQPIADKLLASNTSGIKRYSTWFKADQQWVSKDNPTAFVEFQEKLYYADGTTTKKYKNNIEQNLGIAAPTVQPVLTVVNGPDKIVRVDIVGLTGTGDIPSGEPLTYLFLNIDSTTGLNSGRSKLYFYTTVGAEDAVRLTNVGAAFATSTQVYRLYQGVYRLVGTYAQSTDTVVDNNFDISAQPEFDDSVFITGTIQYGIVYYNSTDGSKSIPLVTPEVVVTSGKVNITNIPVATDPQVDKIQLYRIGGNLTAFSLVATINNGVTTYTDQLGDTDIPGDLLESSTWAPAPTGLKYLTGYKAMLMGAVGDKLYFTEIGLPNAWPIFNYLDFPSTIVGISITQAGLLVHLADETHIITGSRPSEFIQEIHSGDQGSVNHFTSVTRGGSATWVSSDGICTSNGLKTVILTKDRLDQLVLNTVNAVVYDQVYLIQLVDGSIFFADFAFEVFGYKNTGTSFLVTAKGKLYGFAPSNLYELEKSTAAKLAFSYFSPDFVAQGLTNKKLYNKVLINASGQLVVQFFVDDQLGFTGTLNGTKTHEISIAKDFTRGNRLRFTASGSGIIKEVFFDENSANG